MAAPRTRFRVLQFIRDFLEERGYAPTVRDIARGCDISTSSVVQHHLNMLEKEGYIHRDPQVFRSIRLGEKAAASRRLEIPLLGTIAAGEPVSVPDAGTWAGAHETVPLPDGMGQGKNNVYALRVKGTSMIDALVDDGDIVIMEQTSSVDNGGMAAVWLKDRQETTLKKVYREGARVRLQPANSQMAPFFHDAANVEIQGRVIGVVRVMGGKA